MTVVLLITDSLTGVLPGLLATPCTVLGSRAMAQTLSQVSDLRQSYDYIIVGGGTSGLTVGDRLSEDGTSMCILALKLNTYSSSVYRNRLGGGIWIP